MVDTFERATIGSNWTNTPYAGGSLTITGSSDATATGGEVMAYWNANTPPTVTYACGQLSGVGSNSFGGVCVAVDGVSGGNGVCCVAQVGPDPWQMLSRTNGIGAQMDAAGSPTFTPGDWIGIQRTDATHFRCYRSTNGTSWTAIGVGGTATMPNPGHAGLDLTNSANTWFLESWESGFGSLPTGRACGTP